ncbi:MAG: sensor histidine kinase [Clostridiaceae bacterium]|nr:sensor histidine kinase [Clostridiaceae bacterium]
MKRTGRRRIRKFIRNLPIQRKLFFSFLLLIIFPALLIGILSFYRSSELLKHKTGQYTRDILLETCKNIEVKLREAERMSVQVVSNTDIHDTLRLINKGNLNEQEKVQYERLLDKQLREIIASVSGIAAIQVISNTGDTHYINPASISLHTMQVDEEMKRTLESAMGSVCWFDTDPDSRTTAMGRVINSHRTQQKIGYVMVYLRESVISSTFSETELFRNVELFIINEAGNIISCRDKSILGSQNQYTSSEIINVVSDDNFFTAKVNGKNYYVTSRAIQDTSWRMFSYFPAVEYDKEVVWLRNWIWLIILFACLLSVAFSIAIANGISKPVRDLSKKMLKIGDGDFSVSSTYDSKDEIGVLSLHFNKMVVQLKKLIRKAYQEELLKQKAELKSLRMQINPHFLYNSLESINWMARIRGIPEVGKMVKALGDLMRSSIGGEDFITIEEEIRNIENYLTIQKFRYGDKVSVEISIDPKIRKLKIPKLILQPIVENAIIHGIENKVGNGRIAITGKDNDGKILLQVEDDGLGMEEEIIAEILSEKPRQVTNEHTHIGIRNVDRRIRMYYGDQHHIVISSTLGIGTLVSINIPPICETK